jgi:hypothetical protein
MTIRSVRLSRRRCLAWPLAIGLASGVFATMSRSNESAATKSSRPAAKPAEPRYNERGELLLPEDFQAWVFVGANLGVEYRDDAVPAQAGKAPPKNLTKSHFHNVYINPAAYESYAKTGKFPDRTILVLDIYKAITGGPKSIVSEGLFPGKPVGVAAAVKNRNRPDGEKTDWAYYDFGLAQKSAKAFPDKACYDCHLQHADDDNVWVQFYPTLLRIKEQRERKTAR